MSGTAPSIGDFQPGDKIGAADFAAGAAQLPRQFLIERRDTDFTDFTFALAGKIDRLARPKHPRDDVLRVLANA